MSKPTFAIGLSLDNAGATHLVATLITSIGLPTPAYDHCVVRKFTTPISLWTSHDVILAFEDGHGGRGRAHVSLGGNIVCDYTGPTGHEYVDLLAGAWQRTDGSVVPQPVTSYLKLGLDVGARTSDRPPHGISIAATWRGLSA